MTNTGKVVLTTKEVGDTALRDLQSGRVRIARVALNCEKEAAVPDCELKLSDGRELSLDLCSVRWFLGAAEIGGNAVTVFDEMFQPSL